jgi:hypothetical protein
MQHAVGQRGGPELQQDVDRAVGPTEAARLVDVEAPRRAGGALGLPDVPANQRLADGLHGVQQGLGGPEAEHSMDLVEVDAVAAAKILPP